MEGQSYTFLPNSSLHFHSMISTSVLIHMHPDALNEVKDLGLTYKLHEDELDVYVDDVPYEIVDGTYQDPDEQLCEHYGINYDLVNCIEMA